MHVIAVGLVALVLVAGVAFALNRALPGDEAPDPATVAEEPATSEPAEEVAPDPAEPPPAPTSEPSPYEGLPISTPQRGESTRTELMDAARVRTGTDAQFLVWQLFVQGDSAIGDIQEARGASAPGRRWLVAWERTGGSWSATYHIEFLDAERLVAGDAASYLSDGILGEVLFMEPFTAPDELTKAAGRAADEGSPGTVDAPTRIPESWRFTYRAADYGQPGGIPGTQHWHFQEYSDGTHTITHFIGSPEGDFREPSAAPTAVNWSTEQRAYLYQERYSEVAAVGFGDGTINEAYESYLWADADTLRLRAALTAMALSMQEVGR